MYLTAEQHASIKRRQQWTEMADAWSAATGVVQWQYGPQGRLISTMTDIGCTTRDVDRLVAWVRHAMAFDTYFSRVERAYTAALSSSARRYEAEDTPEVQAYKRLWGVTFRVIDGAERIARFSRYPLRELWPWIPLWAAMPDEASVKAWERTVEGTPDWGGWRNVADVPVAVLGYAAGLTLGEVRAHAAAGTQDVEAWRMLAVLRGWPVPLD